MVIRVFRPQVAVYRLFDLAYQINLEAFASTRQRLQRLRSGAVRFESPPVVLEIGERNWGDRTGRLSARLYEFGIVSLCLKLSLGDELVWDRFIESVLTLPPEETLDPLFLEEALQLKIRILPSLIDPADRTSGDGFIAIHLSGLDSIDDLSQLTDSDDVASILLGERDRYTKDLKDNLRKSSYRYAHDDLAILAYDRILVVDPDDIWDVVDLVDFSHAELIELRYYDAVINKELDRVPTILGRRGWLSGFYYASMRQRLMSRHAEVTAIRNRLRASLTITEDLYYARIYRAANNLYGGKELADLLEEKLSVLSEVYGMLSEEVNYFRSHLLEVAIVFLFLIEIIRAFF